MARKKQPVQLGLGFDFHDATTGEVVKWTHYDKAQVDEALAAPWKVVDTETTGLTPDNEDVALSAKEIRQGFNAEVRLRIVSITYPKVLYPTTSGTVLEVLSYGCDHLKPQEVEHVCQAALTGMFVAHNAGFDLYWLGQHTEQMPDLVVDTLLLSRILYPENIETVAKLVDSDRENPNIMQHVRNWAFKFFLTGRAGWALADLVMSRLGILMPKEKQTAKNWTLPFLDQDSHDYATNDIRLLYLLFLDLCGISQHHITEFYNARVNDKLVDLGVTEEYRSTRVDNEIRTRVIARQQELCAKYPKRFPTLDDVELDDDEIFEIEGEAIAKVEKDIFETHGDEALRHALKCFTAEFHTLAPIHDLRAVYEKVRNSEKHGHLCKLIEPQVPDVIAMRKNGIPISEDNAIAFRKTCESRVADGVKTILEMVPSLSTFEHQLKDMGAGTSAALKKSLGDAFIRFGINVSFTKTGMPQIGEKDLRKVQARVNAESQKLFDAWVLVCKAKKAGNMVMDFLAFAQRGKDMRIRALTGHGPVTGRLSSSNPNMQQAPRDQGFRNIVAARPGFKIVASDYSALDMRVGAALALRCQKRILDLYNAGGYNELYPHVAPDVLEAMNGVLNANMAQLEKGITHYAKKLAEIETTLVKISDEKEQLVDRITSSTRSAREKEKELKQATRDYWKKRNNLTRDLILSRFKYRLAQVRLFALRDGTELWSELRNAFSIKGMDIHTWTALVMKGKDPKELFRDVPDEEMQGALKKYKKELGDARQAGKVGNLSLLYAMQTRGLMDAAAKNYEIYWTFEEADDIRRQWLDCYPEIDLWHIWTELNPHAFYRVPDGDRGGKLVKKGLFISYTMADRPIYALGLNAALSYEDQSTGADIVGYVMDYLHREHPVIFACTINQVHDEIVYEVPAEKADEYTAIIAEAMETGAEKFIGGYWGVKAEVGPAIGDVWLKD